jgi:hypothetical protein
MTSKGEIMDQQNKNQERVLCRVGARELAPHELETVAGGYLTLTVPTFDPRAKGTDGDPSHGA